MKNIEKLTVINNIIDVEELSCFSSLKNVKRLEFECADSFEIGDIKNFVMSFSGLKILNLKYINVYGDIAKFLTEFPATQTLILEEYEIYCNISSLLDILNTLGTMKNVQILESFSINKDFKIDIYLIKDLDHLDLEKDLDKQETKDILEKAMEIADQKLPEQTVSIKDTKYGFIITKMEENSSRLEIDNPYAHGSHVHGGHSTL